MTCARIVGRSSRSDIWRLHSFDTLRIHLIDHQRSWVQAEYRVPLVWLLYYFIVSLWFMHCPWVAYNWLNFFILGAESDAVRLRGIHLQNRVVWCQFSNREELDERGQLGGCHLRWRWGLDGSDPGHPRRQHSIRSYSWAETGEQKRRQRPGKSTGNNAEQRQAGCKWKSRLATQRHAEHRSAACADQGGEPEQR